MRIVGYEWMCKSSTRIYLGPLDFHSAAGMPTRIPFSHHAKKNNNNQKTKIERHTADGFRSNMNCLDSWNPVAYIMISYYIPIDPPVLLYPQSLANIPLCFAQHWLFPRYLTENFALRHLIEAYETQLAEQRHRFFRSPVRINELWWHYQPVICSIWGFP